MRSMFWAALLLVASFGIAEAKAVPFWGYVNDVGAGVTGIAVGSSFSGSVTYDENSVGCSAACTVQSGSLTLPGGYLATLILPATINVPEGSLDGQFDVTPDGNGLIYGIPSSQNGALFSGTFNFMNGTFSLYAGVFGEVYVASGTLVPVPAALPLAASALAALGGLGWLKRRRTQPETMAFA